MIAMGILVTCLFGMVGLMRWVVRGSDYGGRLTAATAYAQDKIEQLSQSNYTAVVSGSDTVNGYARDWTVTDNGTYKVLVVQANFKPMDGTTRSVTLREILTP